MPVPASVIQDPLSAVTSGTGAELAINGLYRNITCYISSTGTIAGGAVTLEEAPSSAYAGTWAVIGSATNVPTSGNQVAVIRATQGAYAYVRARISTSVSGGGSATVRIIATD
jgi:hypothetical protein